MRSSSELVEEVGYDTPCEVVGSHVLRCQALGVVECGEGFASMSTLRVGARDVNEEAFLAFEREARCVDAMGDFERFARVAEVDCNRDGVELDVDGPELGVEVVAVCPEPLRDARSLSWPLMRACTRCFAP